MKKIFFALLVFAAMAFIGCSKNEDSPSLKGTVWEEFDDGISTKLTFQSDIACQVVISAPGSGSTTASIADYTYEYNHPTVMAYPKQSSLAALKGIISGNTMNVINTDTGNTIAVLTKK